MLRDSPILILDEPTANLDVEAEAEVMRAIDTLIAGRTVVMISHRLSTLGHADEIIVLAEGEVAERGSFSELERAQGIFARMLAEQYQYSPLQAHASDAGAAEDDIQAADSGLTAARSMSRWFGTLDVDGEADGSAGSVVDLRRARRSARESNSRIRRDP
jgi:ABC-type multidrug transport system ATPase subunit